MSEAMSKERDAIPWYWRALSVASSVMILGGFLMLPITFLEDDRLRLAKTAVGIFATVILVIGFALSGLLSFVVRNPLFQKDSMFKPALTSCLLGFLTIFYNFLVNDRYVWNIPALLLIAAGAVSIVVYGVLLLHARRRIAKWRNRGKNIARITNLQRENSMNNSISSERTLYQEPQFYDNYVRNMFPASAHAPSQPAEGYDMSNITEEEMQRQQMLMLLLQRDASPSPDPASGTYRIDWQGRDEEDAVRTPQQGSRGPQMPRNAMSSLSRHISSQSMQPWDGVWRSPAPMARGRGGSDAAQQQRLRPTSSSQREERRRQIEMGR